MAHVLLDVMVPYWGEPARLYEAVDSVLAQDAEGWRLTIIDDAYPDESVRNRFENLGDPRIRYFRNDANLGITGNFRRCVELAEAEYLSLLGCDDRLLPGYVRTMLDGIERFPQAEIFQPGVQVIDEDGLPYRPFADRVKQFLRPKSTDGVLVSGESLAASLLTGDWMYWPSLVFRTEAIRQVDFNDEFPLVQDLALVLEMVSQGARMVVLPDVVFSYRRHQESASSAKLLDGGRFAGERSFFAFQGERMKAIGWRRASRAAKLHLTSRGYALTLLPKALRARATSSVRALLHHATARSGKKQLRSRGD